MKKTILLVFLAITITAFATYIITTRMCDKRAAMNQFGALPPTLKPNTITLDTFSLDNAKKCIHIFDSTWHSFDPSHQACPIKAFTIKAEDLLAALGITQPTSPLYTHVRVYLGLTPTDTFKLFVVAVDSDGEGPHPLIGKDHFFNVVEGSVHVDPAPHSGHYVMDLNAPCPFTCDEASPLNLPDHK